jgi:hypothetical protein
MSSQARTRFIARMERERALAEEEEENDIEFSITESGRTVTHTMEDSMRNATEGMEFTIGDSTRTSASCMLTETEREDLIDTLQSTRTADISMLTDTEREDLIDTLQSTRTADTSMLTETEREDLMETLNSSRTVDICMLTDTEREDLIETLQDDDEAATVHHSGKSHVYHTTAAQPRPIPLPKGQLASILPPQPQASSYGSSGSTFLSSVLNPIASTFGNITRHTPPTLGSSYEASHFGKRARSGSVSGRLRSASEFLEERGLLDRQTKDILKDLIIIGDEELQRAIDSYEAGDPARLEEMINSGALQNRLPNDIDILDDLDMDFLTMHTDGGVDVGAGGNIEHILSAADHVDTYLPAPPSRHSAQNVTFLQDHRLANMVSPQYNDDGIGDLEFAGDLVSDHGEYLQLDPQAYGSKEASVAASPAEVSNLSEYEQRLRSNSLFSALLNDPKARARKATGLEGIGNESQYGNWMDRSSSDRMIPETQTRQDSRTGSPSAMPSGIGASLEAERKRLEKQAKKEKREKVKQDKKEKKEEEMRLAEGSDEEDKVHVSGSGLPRSLSDPNLLKSLDKDGLVHVERPDGWVGAYSPESRTVRIERYMQKRNNRVWTKTVKYDVRKNFADSRLRVKGRFVKKEDEVLMRELMSLT